MAEFHHFGNTIDGTVISRGASQTNSVIKNTYKLLGITMAWSTLMSIVGLNLHWTPLAAIVCVVASFIALFATMFLRNSPWGIATVFAFTGLIGLSLGPNLSYHLARPDGGIIVAQAVGLTALVFFSLSAYVVKSGKNFSQWGGFLFAGLIVVLIASIAAIFFPVMQVGVAAATALLFSGYILYDTSRLMNGELDNYIMATIEMYLNLVNLFQAILRLLGVFNGRD